MMRKLTLALLAVVVMGLAMPMAAELCTLDNVPAATLLLPYFEVDTTTDGGVTTLFSVNNASATAVLAHVVVWSDLSVPVLDFDIYLTGYDVVTMNMYDIIVRGVLPQTASVGQDPGDAISNQGVISQDINFASCNIPLPPPDFLPSVYTDHLIAALTGNASALGGGCAGQNYGDDIARGYVTVDTVNSCSTFFPGDAGYLGTITTNQNVIWGDFFHVDRANNFAQGEALVHLEAGLTSSYHGDVYPAFVPGDHTFYGRYVATTAVDQREAIPSVYGVRYTNGGIFDGGTHLTVWRDSNEATRAYFSCAAGGPDWYPMGLTQVVVFDEEENPITSPGCPASPCPGTEGILIPAETQLVEVGTDIPVASPFGWIWLNLNHVPGVPVFQDGLAQAWVAANMDASGRFSVGFTATALNQLCGTISSDTFNNPSPILIIP